MSQVVHLLNLANLLLNMKVLVHDGLGIWLCARRLEQGKFHWAQVHQGETVALSPEQLQALIQGLPWQRIGRQQVVTML